VLTNVPGMRCDVWLSGAGDAREGRFLTSFQFVFASTFLSLFFFLSPKSVVWRTLEKIT
jgi:hypothetical protein